MNQPIGLLMEQGNQAFLRNMHEQAHGYYLKALLEAKALKTVIQYIKKNRDNLSKDLLALHELLHKKYHLWFAPAGILSLLNSFKDDVEKIQMTQRYEKFTQTIFSTHPVTPEQIVDAFLENYENQPSQEINFLLRLLQEHGYTFTLFDVNRLIANRSKVQQLTRYKQSLEWKTPTPIEIDVIEGHEFEQFLFDLLVKSGFRVEQ